MSFKILVKIVMMLRKEREPLKTIRDDVEGLAVALLQVGLLDEVEVEVEVEVQLAALLHSQQDEEVLSLT